MKEGLKSERYDRFFLITYPRTALNLLVRILALNEQPNVVTGRNGRYLFLPPALSKIFLKLRGKFVGEWT